MCSKGAWLFAGIMLKKTQTSLTDKVVTGLSNYQLTIAKIILALSTLASSNFCLADIAIIVHPSNNSEFTKASIRLMFLGKKQTFTNGTKIFVYELGNPSPTNQRLFHSKLLHKNQNTLQAYWARMLFSSKATPPIKISSNIAMKHTIANNPQALGYIDTKYLDGSVKPVLILKD